MQNVLPVISSGLPKSLYDGGSGQQHFLVATCDMFQQDNFLLSVVNLIHSAVSIEKFRLSE